ncbi:MAG: alpha-L-arabinofuranosidase C-terminal domain-containing protein [Chloroflexota bacterium]|nr:alpha-L-arabinofuranosidase C-terminal domain-containing protein [Chloroflexota bacterium]
MKARLKIDLDRSIGRINPNIYGQFMCRRPGCSEGGLYEPQAANADAAGLRSDVVQYIQDLRPPILRWPGGCTGTSYHWLDGVGPVEERPSKIDLHFGWPARYEFGTHEFIQFCRRIGAEPHLNFAMGTADLEEAAAWLEYCNGTANTYYANLRRQHGQEDPYDVHYWQLGNEMYGPWEIGYCKAREYGAEAREWAKVLRRLDPSIELIAVGGHPAAAQDWVLDVAPEVCPYVDYLSVHDYWHSGPTLSGWESHMAGPHRTGQVIEEMAAVIRKVRRNNPRSRDISIAVTEWNASPEGTMMANHPELNPFGPTYYMRDALTVAAFMNLMQRRCNIVKLATVAQSINVVGLIMVTKDGVWREPVYWPFWMQANHSGPIALDAWQECDTFDAPELRVWNIPYLDSSVTFDPEKKTLYLSLVNQHQSDAIELDIALPEASVRETGTLRRLEHADPLAMNTPAHPDNVSPSVRTVDGLGSRFTCELPPASYTILELGLNA